MTKNNWKLDRAKFVLGLIWRTGKYLALPWALNLAIFEEYCPLEPQLLNFYFALMITLWIFNIHIFLAHTPRYHEVKR